MTYVTEQSPTELRAHMKWLKAMAGWHEPLADRLYAEIQALDSQLAELRDEADRTARNRDMWKGQCERQAAQLTAMREKQEGGDAPKLYHFEQRSKFGPWIEVGLPTEKSVPFVQYAAMQAMKGDGNGADE